MKLKNKIILSSLFSLTGLFLIGRFVDSQMHGFSYLNFKLAPPEESYVFQNPPEDISGVLGQTFMYLAHGGESVVFESQDHKWVIKFCKRNRIDPLKPLHFLKDVPLLQGYLNERIRIYKRYFHSLKNQATILKDLSWVYYVHFPNKNLKGPIVKLVDPLGSIHQIDTTELSFSIQRKGELFRSVFLQTESLDDKKQMLVKLFDLYKQIESRGMKVWDNAISRNIGWIDNQPFLIDSGAVCDKPAHETFEHNIKYLKTWVIKYEPMLTDFVLDLIATHKASNTL